MAQRKKKSAKKNKPKKEKVLTYGDIIKGSGELFKKEVLQAWKKKGKKRKRCCRFNKPRKQVCFIKSSRINPRPTCK